MEDEVFGESEDQDGNLAYSSRRPSALLDSLHGLIAKQSSSIPHITTDDRQEGM